MSFQVKYGIVSDVKKGFVRVKFEEDDGIVSDWLPVLVRKSKTEKESWPLDVNEHVVCLIDAHCEEGVCVGAIHNEEDTPDPGESNGKFRKLFSDGTLIEYDLNASKLTIDVQGELDAITTGKCKINAQSDIEATTVTNLKGTAGVKAEVIAPAIQLTGAVTITGALVVSAGITAAMIATTGGGDITSDGDFITSGGVNAQGDVIAGTKSLKNHVHTGVTPGGGVSGPPQ